MRQSPIPLLILIASLIGLGGAYAYFQSTQTGRYEAARDVLSQRSEIRLHMLVRYDTGPLLSEEYDMSDIEGTSAAAYRIASRGGLRISITERPRVTLEPGMNVAFFFGEVVNDGIWELMSKPPRGDTATHYDIEIAQVSAAATARAGSFLRIRTIGRRPAATSTTSSSIRRSPCRICYR